MNKEKTNWTTKGNSVAIDPKRALMRAATTRAVNSHGIGGLHKDKNGHKKITLPRLKFMEGEDDGR